MTLKEPFNLNRPSTIDYVSEIVPPHLNALLTYVWQSLVEQKILNTLGVTSLPDWQIKTERMRFTPRTRAGKDALIMAEVERMRAYALQSGKPVDSMHINGPVPYQVIV